MFKVVVFESHCICVHRFVQKAFANPSSFYGLKRPRSQTVRPKRRPPVIFINPRPEICILKASKFPLLNLGSIREEFPMATLCAQPRCVFFLEYGGYATRRLRKAQADCIGYGYAEATMWSSPTRRVRNPLHKQPTWKVCSQKKAAEDRFVEVRRTQQFLKFRFSKGTNAELKLRSTLQQSAGLV